MMNCCSVFHIEQKMKSKKFNCFFVNFLRYSFRRIKFISTVIERKYTLDITQQICFAYQLTGFYMIRWFTERYYLINYSYILENHFYFVNAPDYCFKSSLFRIFRVNSSVKVLSPRYKGPSTHIFCTLLLCWYVHSLQKERNRFHS